MQNNLDGGNLWVYHFSTAKILFLEQYLFKKEKQILTIYYNNC